MVELLAVILLTPILFIILCLLKLSVKLFNLTLALAVWFAKKLWMLTKKLSVLGYRGVKYLWRRFQERRMTQQV